MNKNFKRSFTKQYKKIDKKVTKWVTKNPGKALAITYGGDVLLVGTGAFIATKVYDRKTKKALCIQEPKQKKGFFGIFKKKAAPTEPTAPAAEPTAPAAPAENATTPEAPATPAES